MNLSSSVMYGLGISLGGLEIATDYIYGNSDIYEPELSEVKAVISNKPMKNKMPNRNIKPKISIDGIMDKFRIVKNSTNSVITGEEIIIEDGVMVKTEDDFDFEFDDEPQGEIIEDTLHDESSELYDSANTIETGDISTENVESMLEEVDSVQTISDIVSEEKECTNEDTEIAFSDDGNNQVISEELVGENTKLTTESNYMIQGVTYNTDSEEDELFGEEENELFDDEGELFDEDCNNEDIGEPLSNEEDEFLELFGDEDDTAQDDEPAESNIIQPEGHEELSSQTKDSIDELFDGEDSSKYTDDNDLSDEEFDESELFGDSEGEDDSDEQFDESELFGDEDEDADADDTTSEEMNIQTISESIVDTEEKQETRVAEIEKHKVDRDNTASDNCKNSNSDITSDRHIDKPSISNVSSGNNKLINKEKGVAKSAQVSKQSVQAINTTRGTEDYSAMTIESLYSHVKKFLVQSGVEKKLIEVSVLNDKFGEANIKKLIKKSYLILIGKGVTIGR